jgi:mono/diheme cytochrome c family protein
MAASPGSGQDAGIGGVLIYAFLLVAHSYVRWAVLAVTVAVLVRSANGLVRTRAWTKADERTQVAFVAIVDVQLLLGGLLYLQSSPIVHAFLADPRHAMKIGELRFFGLEHPLLMLCAVTLVHVGRRRSKAGRALETPGAAAPLDRRHAQTMRWTAGALVLMLAAVPWPFLRQGRPLLRGAPAVAHAGAACPATYGARCAACHGERGRGDGIAAASLSPRPRDFTDPTWRANRTDAEIAAVIAGGGASRGLSPAMPAQTDLTEADVDALVGCVRAMAK